MKRLTKPRRLAAAALALAMLMASGCSASVTVEPPEEPTADLSAEPTADPKVIVIPAPEDADFGLIAEEYNPIAGTPSSITVGNITGDTDVLELTDLRFSYIGNLRTDHQCRHIFELVFKTTFVPAFTAEKWEDGQVTEDPTTEEIRKTDRDGYLERYAGGGKWSKYAKAALYSTAEMVDNYWYKDRMEALPEPGRLVVPGEGNEIGVSLPTAEPGIYRYTLYFRESIDNTEEHCTTGGELYSISFEVTIPKSDRDYDLIAVRGYRRDYWNPDFDFNCSLLLLARVNYQMSYVDSKLTGIDYLHNTELEMLKDGEWETLPDGIYRGYDFDDNFCWFETDDYLQSVELNLPDPEGKYRLSLGFTDGGHKYSIVLYLNLAE